jgi:EAL domain-containing protein (putative c-di-GMP-specific phosphodiesterase class I)
VQRIKIDRSFVQMIGTGSDSGAIVRAMIDLARALSLQVTAEGVETVEQRDFLYQAGCDELQGFLLSRPLTAQQVDERLGLGLRAGDRETIAAAA